MEPASQTAAQIERQVRRWEFLQRAAEPTPPPRCIAISRLPGSGAMELGRRVAEKLDYGFFGIELLDQIARERGVPRRLLEGVDEQLRGSIERYVVDTLRRGAFTESEYLRHIVQVVTTLGERGGAVLLGRGAPYILSEQKSLRVFIVAPREKRIDRVASEHKIPRHQAEVLLKDLDEERRSFLKYHFSIEPDDPTLYDLVVNTGALGLDTAAQIVLDALQGSRPGAT